MIVPLMVRGRAIGSITLLSTREGRHYAAGDLAFAESLGERVALAIENARLYEAVHVALAGEREARLRADFLANAGALLDASLDYEQTLANVAQITVPEIADWCAVSVLDDGGSLREVATAHVDPAKRAIARELQERWPTARRRRDAARPAVARTGQTQYVREVTDEMIVAGARDPEHLELIRSLGLRSVVTAPLIARGRTFGTITLASAESERLFEEADVQLAEELARARGRRDRQRPPVHRAHPDRAHAPGAAAARAPAGDPEHADRGALPRRGRAQRGRRRLLRRLRALEHGVGDGRRRRVGQGRRGRRRHRAGALHAARRGDGRLLAQRARCSGSTSAMLADGSSQFATVVLAYVAQAPEGLRDPGRRSAAIRRRCCCARGGEVEAVGTFGGLLGLLEAPRLHDATATLTPGDVLLLYTDGVTEAGPRDAPVRPVGARVAADRARRPRAPGGRRRRRARPPSARRPASRATTSPCSRCAPGRCHDHRRGRGRGRPRRAAGAAARLLRLLRGRAVRRAPAGGVARADRRPRARGRAAARPRRIRRRGRLRDGLLVLADALAPPGWGS